MLFYIVIIKDELEKVEFILKKVLMYKKIKNYIKI